MNITNEHIGGFLMAEGILSILLAPNKEFIPQAARLIRVGIGFYIYKNVSFIL